MDTTAERNHVTPTPIPSTRIHVSPQGDNAGAGTVEAPFRTLRRALEEVAARKRSSGLPADGLAVVLADGTYEIAESVTLGPEVSGKDGASVFVCALPGVEARLAGAQTLSASAFAPVADPAVLARLEPAARGRVVEADLTALGIDDLGEFPIGFRGFPLVPELFFNDRRMTLARWPNEGWTTIASILDAGSRPDAGDECRPGVFEYEGDRPKRWNVEDGVWLRGYWCFDWFEEAIRVGAIDAEARCITLGKPHQYTVRQGNPSPRRYCALNLLEELDVPGEYYIDRATGKLYFWPPGKLADAHIVLSTLRAPLLQLENCEHVTLRGLVLETGLDCAVAIRGGNKVSVESCGVRNLRGCGIEVQGGRCHRIDSCDIHDTGAGGILLEGGDRKTLVPAGHQAINNHIHHFSCHQLTYASGIHLGGVGNRAAHNLLHDAPHMAIGVSGNDHVFELNTVHHVCTETDDCGALYKGRNPSCTGNIIRNNFWHHVGSPMGHGNAAIYFDDGDVGDQVTGNIFFRCGEPGKGSFGTVFCHGGHDHLVQNNIFIECRRAMGSAPWNDRRWKDYIEADLWQTRLLEEIDITRPPYTTRYPHLIGFMDPKPGEPRISQGRWNLFFRCGEVGNGNWQCPEEENLVTGDDPGFVDLAGGDFTLRPDAEVFRELRGFEQIPFVRMGLVACPLRPHPVVEEWSYDPPNQLDPPVDRRRSGPVVREGPIPTFQVKPRTRPLTADGWLDPAVWTDLPVGERMPVGADGGGVKAHRPASACLMHDGERLQVLIECTIHPDTNLSGNRWGTDDAVEIAMQPLLPGVPGAIHVLRGFGNGRLEFGIAADGGAEPTTMEPASISYRASRPAPDRWRAEFAIPFHMVDLDLETTRKIAFNLTVRQPRDDLWIMWAPTHGHTYDVDYAGVVEFVD